MSSGSNSSPANAFLLSKTELTIADSQFIDILLHGQTTEQKIQTVNRWCKNSRRNRLSSILDVTQRHDVLLSLATTLQQSNTTEFQYNCLTLLSELQGNIHHYDQRIYLPGKMIKEIISTSFVRSFSCYPMLRFIVQWSSIVDWTNFDQADSFHTRHRHLSVHLYGRRFKVFQYSFTSQIDSITHRTLNRATSIRKSLSDLRNPSPESTRSHSSFHLQRSPDWFSSTHEAYTRCRPSEHLSGDVSHVRSTSLLHVDSPEWNRSTHPNCWHRFGRWGWNTQSIGPSLADSGWKREIQLSSSR